MAKKLAALAKANPEAARAQVWAEIVRVKAVGARNLAENIRSRVTWAEANSEAARDQAATARAQAINNYVNLDLDLHFWDRQKKYAALAKVDDATMNLEDTSKNAEARAEAARKYADWAEANPVAAQTKAAAQAEAARTVTEATREKRAWAEANPEAARAQAARAQAQDQDQAVRMYNIWAEANPEAARARAEVRAEAEAAMARRTQVRA